MQALTVSDLQVLAEEPRVRDVDLAERLGFRRPRKVRELIQRSLSELQRYGVCPTVGRTSGPRGGRPTQEYLLNEPQALLVCIKSDAPAAADVRQQLIDVFMAWRHGRPQPTPQRSVAQAPPALPPPPRDPVATALQLMGGRMLAADLLGQISEGTDHGRIAAQLNRLDIWSEGRPGRRPAWFWDTEVVSAVFRTWRGGTLDVVHIELVRAFGTRAPSRSALHRFWQRLDEIKHRGLH